MVTSATQRLGAVYQPAKNLIPKQSGLSQRLIKRLPFNRYIISGRPPSLNLGRIDHNS
jgi:hypothetical protein